tara:strand:+ start:20 stop:448 length:429 start_codon:yes stop_codon:yes gene_type:complete
MKLLGLLNEAINKKRLISLLKTMDITGEDAKSELEGIVSYVKELPEELKLYRILSVDSKDEINKDELGSHYSTDRKNLLSSHDYVTGSGEEYYLVTVKVKKSMVDVMETLENNILYPNEKEITLKDKGKGVEIISIKKINKG